MTDDTKSAAALLGKRGGQSRSDTREFTRNVIREAYGWWQDYIPPSDIL